MKYLGLGEQINNLPDYPDGSFRGGTGTQVSLTPELWPSAQLCALPWEQLLVFPQDWAPLDS